MCVWRGEGGEGEWGWGVVADEENLIAALILGVDSIGKRIKEVIYL